MKPPDIRLATPYLLILGGLLLAGVLLAWLG